MSWLQSSWTLAVQVWGSVLPLRAFSTAQATFRWLVHAYLSFTAMGLTSIATAQEKRFEFSIPAQSLSSAIEAYSKATERDVLFNSNLTVGRRSMAVQGLMPADTALMVLLEGTGLSARYETSGSFVLLPTPDSPLDVPSPPVAQFYGHLQKSLRAALCSNNEARPGSYRVAVRLWIGAEGKVIRSQRLSSTGRSDIDEGLDRALSHFDIGTAPPRALAQPVTVVIVPEAPGLTMGCRRDVRAAP